MRSDELLPETFEAILRRYRAAAGFTQEELAKRAGLSRRAISDLERGMHLRPYPATVRRLAEALQLKGADSRALQAASHPLSLVTCSMPESPQPVRRGAAYGRLPEQPTTLFGRERELIDIQLLLLRPEVRLLTLCGCGGCGKTRLAVAVAKVLRQSFASRVFFVDLSPLRDPAYVTASIAHTLGLSEGSNDSLLSRLQPALASLPTLLVLDNFEHLSAAAPQMSELLAACPELKLLVTSRTALRMRWEHQFLVLPLALPEAMHLVDLEAMATVPSVALFLDRARATGLDLPLSRDNAEAIALICQRLDGLPLALELAAARTSLLPPQALAKRLDPRLPLLVDGPGDLPARQRTLRAAIDWSYQLLEPSEQRLFQRLALFAGGGRIEQIEQVCREASEPAMSVLGGLESLVDKNLVRRESAPDGEPRLRMLETIGEFALEQLALSGELEETRRRYALTFLALAEAAEIGLLGAQRRVMVGPLAAELDNLRAALVWMLDHGEAELSCRLTSALTWLWYPLDKMREGRIWAERSLGCWQGRRLSPAPAKALFNASVLALFLGDTLPARRWLEQCLSLYGNLLDKAGVAQTQIYLGIAVAASDAVRARVLHEEALGVFRHRGDAHWTAVALLSSGLRAFVVGEPVVARKLFEESLDIFRQLGDGMMAAEALNKLGDVARIVGDYERAAKLYTESLELLYMEGGGSGIPGLLHNLGYIAQQCGELQRSHGFFDEALARFRANGDQRGIAECLAGMAGVVAVVGHSERAVRLFGAAETAFQAAGAAISPSNVEEYERNLAALRSCLGKAAFVQAWRAGQVLSLDQACAEASATAEMVLPHKHEPAATDPWLGLLTPRESEVAELILSGLSNRQIAGMLFITEQTVETHVKRLLSKLGLTSRHHVQQWMQKHRSHPA